jgi:hypothetical protein
MYVCDVCVCVAVHYAANVPVYSGPTAVEWLSPGAFNERVKAGTGAGGKANDEAWLVMFYADWSSACAHLDPTFAVGGCTR